MSFGQSRNSLNGRVNGKTSKWKKNIKKMMSKNIIILVKEALNANIFFIRKDSFESAVFGLFGKNTPLK